MHVCVCVCVFTSSLKQFISFGLSLFSGFNLPFHELDANFYYKWQFVNNYHAMSLLKNTMSLLENTTVSLFYF